MGLRKHRNASSPVILFMTEIVEAKLKDKGRPLMRRTVLSATRVCYMNQERTTGFSI